jgi:hypothetical protein
MEIDQPIAHLVDESQPTPSIYLDHVCTFKFSKQTLIFGHPLFRHFFPEDIYQ